MRRTKESACEHTSNLIIKVASQHVCKCNINVTNTLCVQNACVMA